MQIRIEDSKQERKALTQIREIIREERLRDIARRAHEYLFAIGEMKDVVDTAGETTPTQAAALIAIRDFAQYGGDAVRDVGNVIRRIESIAEETLDAPMPAHTPTEEELRDIYSEKHTNAPILEDKQLILDLLLPALKATRCLEDLTALSYDANTESVDAFFASGGIKRINVACDSGIAMIRDVLRGIG